jgi:hypothetical protein
MKARPEAELHRGTATNRWTRIARALVDPFAFGKARGAGTPAHIPSARDQRLFMTEL